MTQPDQPTAASGSSAKWIALGCGGCLGVTVFAMLALGFLISRSMRFAIGPELPAADGPSLFAYELPGESEGRFAMDLLGLRLTQVSSTDSPPSVLLTMGQLPRYLQDQAAREAFVQQFQDSVTVEGTYTLAEQRVEQRTLCDQPVSVLLQSGRFEDEGDRYNAASLITFVDHDATARFVWILAHGDTPEATADQVFDTLMCQ
jgi:hypothetical protein